MILFIIIIVLILFCCGVFADNRGRLPEDVFYDIARNTSVCSDKVGNADFDKDVRGHTFQTMYGMMIPYIEMMRYRKQRIKMLEIGLGCHMKYGAGASVGIWRRLLEAYPPTSAEKDELWEAEVDSKCAEAKLKEGALDGIHVLIGDQSDPATVRKWKQQGGDNFDFIIDDGGHDVRDIVTSFEILWDAVAPGGYYFLEDLHASAGLWLAGRGQDKVGGRNIALLSLIRRWMDQLVVARGPSNAQAHPYTSMPKGLKWIMCQVLNSACNIVALIVCCCNIYACTYILTL